MYADWPWGFPSAAAIVRPRFQASERIELVDQLRRRLGNVTRVGSRDCCKPRAALVDM